MTKFERLIRTSLPVVFLRNLSKRIVPPGFSGVPLYDVYQFFSAELKKSSINTRAKSIAYDFAMAIPAVLICLFTLIPYMPASKKFASELLKLTKNITPNQNSYNFVQSFLRDFLETPRVGLMSFGFILVIFYASNAMMSIIRTFDTSIYKHHRNKNIIKRRIKALRLTLIILILFVATVLISIGQGILFDFILKSLHLRKSEKSLIASIRWVIIIALFFYSISLIYRYAPSVKKRWPLISAGSVLATIMMMLTTIIFSYWVNHFNNYNKIYGSIGTIMILMLLIYINSLILLFGFELNLSITYLKKKEI